MPRKEQISATLRRMALLSSPSPSSPKASSPETVSVTVAFSVFCKTYPISLAASRSESASSALPQ